MTLKVNEPSEDVKAMQPDWDIVETLMGGTKAIRNAGLKYLPKRELETTTSYEKRLTTSTLFPAFKETVVKMTGRVFAEKIKTGEDIPQWITDEVLDNIDLQDRNFQVFAREWFLKALEKGHMGVLVEAQQMTEDVQSQADQKKQGLRPYTIPIDPKRILGWKQDANGKLIQLRLTFCREIDDGPFGTIELPQVKVYDRKADGVWVTTYEPDAANANKSSAEFKQVGSSVKMGVEEIPFVVYYTDRKGFLKSRPPLIELAYLNIQHWQVKSATDSLLNKITVPILTITSDDPKLKIKIDESYALNLPMGAEMKFVEHTGKAIEAGNNRILKLEQEMEEAGAKLLAQKTGGRSGGSSSGSGGSNNKTATEVSEDAATKNSALGTMVEDYADALDALLDMIAMYRGEEDGGSAEPQANLSPDMPVIDLVKFLLDMSNSGKLSDKSFFEEVQNYGLISDELSWDTEEAEIKKQLESLGLGVPSRKSGTTADPNAPAQPSGMPSDAPMPMPSPAPAPAT